MSAYTNATATKTKLVLPPRDLSVELAVKPGDNFELIEFVYTINLHNFQMLTPDASGENFTGQVSGVVLSHKLLVSEQHARCHRDIYGSPKGIGATPAFSQIDERTINKILETRFEGKNYSQRIWGNTNVLAEQLREKLAKAIATGQSIDKTAREFRERFGVSESYAKRLIRTETCYFENAAEIESYREMGVEYYVFVAVRDARTSEICSETDGEKFKVKDAMAGVNLPPMHPNCRSTIRAYLGEEYEPEIMIYRDPENGRNKYTSNMSYKKWYSIFVSPEGSPKLVISNEKYGIVDDVKVVFSEGEPGRGRVLKELGAAMSQHEETIANWIHDKFGGTVTKLAESSEVGVKRADFMWLRRDLESKRINGSVSSIDNALRKGAKQSKSGRIIIDIASNKRKINDILADILHYMQTRELKEVFVKYGDDLIAHYVRRNKK